MDDWFDSYNPSSLQNVSNGDYRQHSEGDSFHVEREPFLESITSTASSHNSGQGDDLLAHVLANEYLGGGEDDIENDCELTENHEELERNASTNPNTNDHSPTAGFGDVELFEQADYGTGYDQPMPNIINTNAEFESEQSLNQRDNATVVQTMPDISETWFYYSDAEEAGSSVAVSAPVLEERRLLVRNQNRYRRMWQDMLIFAESRKADMLIDVGRTECHTCTYGEIANVTEESCSICIEDYGRSDFVSQTRCKHMFHEKCLTLWAKSKITCPLCRNIIKVTLPIVWK